MTLAAVDVDRFARRLGRVAESPRTALREAMAEGAVADAGAAILLANALVAVLCLAWLTLRLSVLNLPALAKFSMLPRLLVSANVAVAVSIAAHLLIGRALGGRASARDALVVFGFAALPTAPLLSLHLFGPVPDLAGVLGALAINGFAVLECHRFRDLRPALVTAILGTVAARGILFFV